jgi:5'-3' exonuclease
LMSAAGYTKSSTQMVKSYLILECALGLNKEDSGWKRAFTSIFKPLVSRGHQLLFVFDGKTPEIKKDEHNKRRINNVRNRELALELIKNEETRQKGLSVLVKTIEVSELIPEVKRIISDFGAQVRFKT